MGLLNNFKTKKNNLPNNDNPEQIEFTKIASYMTALEKHDRYVAKSENKAFLEENKEIINKYITLEQSGMLKSFCRKNKIFYRDLKNFTEKYVNLDKITDEENDKYLSQKMIEEKEYLDNILVKCDPKIKLDDDQRKVVLTDEDYCLVVAGAGAGKTTTVSAKVKYLVDKQHIDPKKILVISFTNKAVNELKQRINKELEIPCPIATFHSTGNAILHKQNDEKLNIVDEFTLYKVVRNYFKQDILKNESAVNSLIMFFASYFDAPMNEDELKKFFARGSVANYTTLKSEMAKFQKETIDARTQKKVTIQSEVMRSIQEVQIANFLYMNNIDYEYEPIYQYDIQFSRKPYTPDFIIKQGENVAYIEHFGITEDGSNNLFSPDQLEHYKKAVNDKVKLHKAHGTKLIYTFSSFKDGRTITEHLKEQLENNGFTITPRDNREVLQCLIESEENRYIRRMIMLVMRFIHLYKTDGYDADEFRKMSFSTDNVRSKLFLDICQGCYYKYQQYLRENDAIDFEDMINESARILRDVQEMKQKLDFDYIIVDEYQDISRQRFDLVQALHRVCNAKFIAVGDDWQSIYAFSGSDVSLFTDFEKKMGYAKMMKIVKTYRNSQEVIDIAGSFVQKNKTQIRKELISPKHIKDPVIIYTYDASYKQFGAGNTSGANYALAHALETALAQIIEFNKKEGKPVDSSILLLGRFGFDGEKLEKSGLFRYINRENKLKSEKYPFLNINFMTVHASKGLGYDNVIVLNGRNETYGFPSKIKDDPVLNFVMQKDNSMDYAEERRLFYVAMTRTKNRVFFVAPEYNPSEFLLELKQDYKNILLKGKWNENYTQSQYAKLCPICGYPLQFLYKRSYGLKLYVCTNEPELCGFMTNNYSAGKMQIMKCDQCRDGYLIVKPSEKDIFMLGCSNYRRDGKGCNKIVSKKEFYGMMGYRDDIPAPEVVIPKGMDIKPNKKAADNSAQSQNDDFKTQKIEVAKVKAVYYNENNLNKIIVIILQCLSDISEHHFFGVCTLIDVLRGSQSKKMVKYHFETVTEYGSLKNISREDLEIIINWLIQNKYILQTKERYPVLHRTNEGMHYSETITYGMLTKLKKILEK